MEIAKELKVRNLPFDGDLTRMRIWPGITWGNPDESFELCQWNVEGAGFSLMLDLLHVLFWREFDHGSWKDGAREGALAKYLFVFDPVKLNLTDWDLEVNRFNHLKIEIPLPDLKTSRFDILCEQVLSD